VENISSFIKWHGIGDHKWGNSSKAREILGTIQGNTAANLDPKNTTTTAYGQYGGLKHRLDGCSPSAKEMLTRRHHDRSVHEFRTTTALKLLRQFFCKTVVACHHCLVSVSTFRTVVCVLFYPFPTTALFEALKGWGSSTFQSSKEFWTRCI
jgi:hypothetical protein